MTRILCALFPFFGVSCVMASPAHAASPSLFAKKDPCAKPPQSIPETERQKVQAAVGATVQAINVGAEVSGGSDREASYRVVGFTSEGFEGAWLRYEMCEQRANGVITAEQYDQFLAANGLLAAGARSPAVEDAGGSAGATATPATAAASTSPSLVGGWTVTSSFVRSSCPPPADTFGVDTLDWLVSVSAAGEYAVEVRGSSFTHLQGGSGTTPVVLTGTRPTEVSGVGTVGEQTTYVLAPDGEQLSGQRLVALVRPVEGHGTVLACTVEFDVRGQRR